MKNKSSTLAVLATSLSVFGTAALAADVVVKVGEPGYFGRIEVLDAPKPVLISTEPVIIQRERMINEPTYVYVPADQRTNWAANCSKYEACGRPVYFVEDRWYNDVYVPHYKSRHQMKSEAKAEFKDEKREAKRDYKDAKEEAKRDYKDAKRDARNAD